EGVHRDPGLELHPPDEDGQLPRPGMVEQDQRHPDGAQPIELRNVAAEDLASRSSRARRANVASPSGWFGDAVRDWLDDGSLRSALVRALGGRAFPPRATAPSGGLPSRHPETREGAAEYAADHVVPDRHSRAPSSNDARAW